MDEPVEQPVGVGVEHDQADDGEPAGEHTGAEGAQPERPLELGVARADGIGGEEHRRQVGRARDRDYSDHDPGRVEPACEQVAGRVADRDAQ